MKQIWKRYFSISIPSSCCTRSAKSGLSTLINRLRNGVSKHKTELTDCTTAQEFWRQESVLTYESPTVINVWIKFASDARKYQQQICHERQYVDHDTLARRSIWASSKQPHLVVPVKSNVNQWVRKAHWLLIEEDLYSLICGRWRVLRDSEHCPVLCSCDALMLWRSCSLKQSSVS